MLAITPSLISICGLARRSRPGPAAVTPGPRPPLLFRALASTSHRRRWPGWQKPSTPGLRRRPSPAPGHARSRRDCAAGCPSTGGGPVPSSQGDHRTVAL
jgi:hypothetical protein